MRQTDLTRGQSIAIARGLVAPTAARSYSWVEEMDNDSGDAIVEGNVVVVLADGTIQLADTLNDPRPTGVAVDDIDDGESGQVCFGGPVDLVMVTGAVSPGDYGQTSTTAGLAQVTTGPATAFCMFTSAGTEPTAFLWGGRGGGGLPVSGGTGSGAGDAIYTNSPAGSSLSVGLSDYVVFDITLTANLTLTFTDPPSDGLAHEWIFILRQGGVGDYTVSWPGTVQWQKADGTTGGTATPLFTSVGAINVFRVTTLDDGTTYGAASVLGTLRWEAVTNGEDIFVWEGTDLVHEWRAA